jgi:hypothetical protein
MQLQKERLILDLLVAIKKEAWRKYRRFAE